MSGRTREREGHICTCTRKVEREDQLGLVVVFSEAVRSQIEPIQVPAKHFLQGDGANILSEDILSAKRLLSASSI